MKKILYILTLLILGACSKDNLPEANFELYQLDAVSATAGDRAATIAWTAQKEKNSPDSFLLSWSAGSKDVAGGSMEIAADKSSVVIEGLTNNIAYTFALQGRYAKGLSMKTSAACTPKSTRFPVTELLAAAGSAKVRLTWVKPASDKLKGYKITYSPDEKSLSIDTPEAERYVVDGLTNGTKYEFTVTAIYSNGESESQKVEATPGVVLPITVSTTSLVQNQPISFSVNDMYFLRDEVSSVAWSFGDGNTSTQLNPIHRFAAPGIYNVEATVTYADKTTENGVIEMSVIGFQWSSIALVNGAYTGAVKASNPVFSPDGSTLYIPTSNKAGDLFAIDIYTGQIKWVYAIAGVTYGGGAAVGNDGSIYQGAQDKKMYAIKANGTEKWTFTSSGSIEGFPAITSDNKLYFGANGAKATLYSLNATTGAAIWSKELEGGVASAVAVDGDGNAYIGTDKAIYSFTSAGDQRWVTSEAVNSTERGSFAISGTTLYAALKGKDGVAAVNMTSGEVIWRSGAATGDSYMPVVDRLGAVYFTDKGSAKVFAFNADGTKKWEAASGSALIYAGLVLSSDGKLYVGTQKATFKILSIDATSGSLLLDEAFGEQIMSGFSIGPDSRLYFGSVAGKITARELSAGLETGSWSVRGGDMQGTNSLK